MSRASESRPEEVLEFWFGVTPTTEAQVMDKTLRWFRGGAALDHEVIARFGPIVTEAVDGGLEAWHTTPRARLALVLLLDQLTRNVFRDSPRMYAGDERAQRLALEAFADGSASHLSFIEQLFLSMPLLHAESLALHERETEIAKSLAALARPPWLEVAAMRLEQSAKYRDVVARFGRFPHRNALLGRESTRDELEFLENWDAQAPPKGMPSS